MTLHELAQTLGWWCWTERRLFEIVGSWVPSTTDAAVKVHFAETSHRCAWRAARLEELLPTAYVPPASTLLRPGPGAASLDVLAGLDATVPRLAALYRVVVPAGVAAYDHWLDAATLTERPYLRAVRGVRADLVEDWIAGAGELRRRVRTGADAAIAAAACADVEAAGLR
jgi:hypothetical protein